VQSRSSLDGETGERSVVKMVEAVKELEKAAGDRAGAGGLGSREEKGAWAAEEEVIRVLGLCARAAKFGAQTARVAVEHALRAVETLRGV
jgi:hypothetical protein